MAWCETADGAACTIFRLTLIRLDGVDNVVRADPPVIGPQILLIQPHHPSFLHPGHRHRHHVGGVSSLKGTQKHPRQRGVSLITSEQRRCWTPAGREKPQPEPVTAHTDPLLSISY